MTIMNLAATCAVALALATPARAGQLLSIQGFRLPQKLHIDTLDLTIPDAHVLAYCHIPDGWILTTKQTPEKALTLSGGDGDRRRTGGPRRCGTQRLPAAR